MGGGPRHTRRGNHWRPYSVRARESNPSVPQVAGRANWGSVVLAL